MLLRVIALMSRSGKKRLGVCRREELAAVEADGGAGRERVLTAISAGIAPARLAAADIGALIG